jgi:hypothetical protein
MKENSAWLSPHERKQLVNGGCTCDPSECQCRIGYLYRHALEADKRVARLTRQIKRMRSTLIRIASGNHVTVRAARKRTTPPADSER